MKVYFRQFYVEPGVAFPFSHCFSSRLSDEITAIAVPSPTFIKKYGHNFDLVFNISAKREIKDIELRGPTVFRKTKDVEYTVFLPFDVITGNSEVPQSAIRYLLSGVRAVFTLLGFDTEKLVERQEAMINRIPADPMMFERGEQGE